MTHTQALAGNRSGIAPTNCSGHLAHYDSFHDCHLTHEGPTTLIVTVYRCEKCNHRIVVERIAESIECVKVEFRVMNDYLPIGPRQMVRALAGRLALGIEPPCTR